MHLQEPVSAEYRSPSPMLEQRLQQLHIDVTPYEELTIEELETHASGPDDNQENIPPLQPLQQQVPLVWTSPDWLEEPLSIWNEEPRPVWPEEIRHLWTEERGNISERAVLQAIPMAFDQYQAVEVPPSSPCTSGVYYYPWVPPQPVTPIEQPKPNYHAIETSPQWKMYQYDVTITPEENDVEVRKALLEHHSHLFGGHLFDGKLLHTPKKLPDPLILSVDPSNGTAAAAPIKLTIKRVHEFFPTDTESHQVLEVCVRKSLQSLDLKPVDGEYLDPVAKVDVPNYDLEIWPGYTYKIHQFPDKLAVIVKITPRVVSRFSVLFMMRKFKTPRGDIQKRRFSESLVGRRVITPFNKKSFQVDMVCWNISPCSRMIVNGRNISYREYFQKVYNIDIVDENQPILVSRSSPEDMQNGFPPVVYLVPEMCRVFGLSAEMRSNSSLITALEERANIPLHPRVLYVLNKFTYSEEVTTRSVDRVPLGVRLKTTAEMLPLTIASANISHYITNYTISYCKVVIWAVIVPEWLTLRTEEFIQVLVCAGRFIDLDLTTPEIVKISEVTPTDYARACENVIRHYNPAYILCILEFTIGNMFVPYWYEVYNNCLAVDRSVPVQLLWTREMTHSSANKIALIVSTYLMREMVFTPWAMPLPLNIRIPSIMVVAYDVCFDSIKKKAYGAFVASVDQYMEGFYSSSGEHTTTQMNSLRMGQNIRTALWKFRQRVGVLPEQVLVFRRGVYPDEQRLVAAAEPAEIKLCMSKIYGQRGFNLMYTIVDHPSQIPIRANSMYAMDDEMMPLPYGFECPNRHRRDPDPFDLFGDDYRLQVDRDRITREEIRDLSAKLSELYYGHMERNIMPNVCAYANNLASIVYRRQNN